MYFWGGGKSVTYARLFECVVLHHSLSSLLMTTSMRQWQTSNYLHRYFCEVLAYLSSEVRCNVR